MEAIYDKWYFQDSNTLLFIEYNIPEEGVNYTDCNVSGTNGPHGYDNGTCHNTFPFLSFSLMSGLSHFFVDLLWTFLNGRHHHSI